MMPTFLSELAEDGYTVEANKLIPFTERLTHPVHGTEMAVDGTADITFDLPPSDKGRMIKSVVLVITDSSINTDKFGAQPELPHGISLAYIREGQTGYFFERATSIGDIHVASGGSGSMIDRLKGKGTEAYLAQINHNRIPLYVAPGAAGTVRLYLADDLSNLASMYVEVSGYREI